MQLEVCLSKHNKMIFLQLWWTLMALTGTTNTQASQQCQLKAGSEELRNFQNSINEARDQLQEIHSNYGQVQGAELYRHRRNSIDDLLASFAQADAKETAMQKDNKALNQAADDWLRGFGPGVVHEQPAAAEDATAVEATLAEQTPANKYQRATDKAKSNDYIPSYSKSFDQTEVGKVKKKYKETTDESLPANHLPLRGGASELDIKLRQMQHQLNNHELQQSRDNKKETQPDTENSLQPDYGNGVVPSGAYEQTMARLQLPRLNANNLSHEANYKLSKIEQEAAEQATKMRYPAGLKKRSSSIGFNPMNEIKLKTSNRLMRKGMGPSLPSNALSDTLRAHYVDDMLMRRQLKMEREREKEERQQQQEEDDQKADIMKLPYESLGSIEGRADSKGSSNLDLPNIRLLDMPQSYDYRMPQFDQFPATKQRTLRDYVHANAKLTMEHDGERFKRQPEQLKETQTELKLTKIENESNLKQSEAWQDGGNDNSKQMPPGGDAIMARLSAPETVKDDRAQPILTETELKIENRGVDQLKPSQELGVVEVQPEAAQVNEQSKLQEHADVSADAQFLTKQSQSVNEDAQQQLNKAQSQEEVNVRLVDEKEKEIMKNAVNAGKANREERPELLPRNGMCMSHPDAGIKLLPTKISQHEKERDKRNIKRRLRKRKLRHRLNRNVDLSKESHYKRRSKRSVDTEQQVLQEATAQVEAQSKSVLQTKAEARSRSDESETQLRSKRHSRLQPRSEAAEPYPQSHSQLNTLSETMSKMQPRSKSYSELEAQSEAQLDAQSSSKRNQDTKLEIQSETQLDEPSEVQSETHPDSQLGQRTISERYPKLEAEPYVQFHSDVQQESVPQSQRFSHSQSLSDSQSELSQLDSHSKSQSESDLSLLTPPELELRPLNIVDSHSQVLDASEDHNGNRLHYGNLGNDLYLDAAKIAEDSDNDNALPYERFQLTSAKNEETAQELDASKTNIFSDSRYQVPMMSQRYNNPQAYQPVNLQPYMSQSYMQPQQQLLQPHELQQCQPPQQQQFQQQLLTNNLKSNLNFTQLFNELAMMQKPQDQQQLQQQQHQQNLESYQLKPLYGVHRYFDPIFNQSKKLNCEQLTTEPAATTTAKATLATTTTTTPSPTKGTITAPLTTPTPAGTTVNPVCVPIQTDGATPGPGNALPGNICNRPESVKLNLSLNANVCGDPKTNQFIGNGTVIVLPSGKQLSAAEYFAQQDLLSNEGNMDLYQDERYSREAMDRSEEAKEQRQERHKEKERSDKKKGKKGGKGKADHDKSSTSDIHLDMNEPYSEHYGKLISGKLSDDIVHAVFDMVSNDPSMDALITVLAKNRKCAGKNPKNFYQIRNNQNEKQLAQTEFMVRRTMETISDLIDKQMQMRNCLPLRPDLVEFYNLIVKNMAEQQKTRDKREANLRLLAENYSQEDGILEPANIEQKSRIVKKLLREFEELPLEQQKQAAGVRDELLMDLIYLRKMSDTLERNQRNAQLNALLRKATISEDADDQQVFQDYSPRFIKLLKTAEIFKEVGEQQTGLL
ncbi:trichohyalin isoform X2 [Drosophila hydei]|uniref:Trichohyalin isoform X2 n=1 Tax=Drosophila hydei TaxID=7224 RepID=A0A6J2SXW9_DROHY|nr:trichohyalin isoform X2 [Drosophila hydei]